jgi:hypothetical protein
MEEGLEAWRANKGRPSHMEAHYNSSSSPTRGPGAVFGKTESVFDVLHMVGKLIS